MSYFQVFYLCLLSSALLICSVCVVGMPIPHVAVDEKVMSYSIKNQVASTLSCMAKADQIASSIGCATIPFNTTSVKVFWEGGEGTYRGNFFFVWYLQVGADRSHYCVIIDLLTITYQKKIAV